MNDLLRNIGDRRSRAELEFLIRPDGQDSDLEEGLNKLESELTEAITGKQATQDLIQKYRLEVQDIQAWFDVISKRVDAIEKGNGSTISKKITALKEITSEFESNAPER